MFGSIRNALVAGLIAAAGTIGVSYAATGSLNPVEVISTTSEGGSSATGGANELAAGSSEVTPTEGEGPPGGTGGGETESATGPERSTVGCGGFTGTDGKFNHGQFVRQSPKGSRSDAARSPCGKPVHAENEAADAPETENEVENQGRGHSADGGPGNSDFGHSQGKESGKAK